MLSIRFIQTAKKVMIINGALLGPTQAPLSNMTTGFQRKRLYFLAYFPAGPKAGAGWN